MIDRMPVVLAGCFVSAVVVLVGLNEATGQYTEVDSFLTSTVAKTIGSEGYSTAGSDDTAAFQSAINDVRDLGGGKVIVPRGTYDIGRVDLQDNVHLVFDGQSTIRPYTVGLSPNTNLNLFNFGESGSLKNASVRSINSATHFEFDRTVHDRVRAFRVADASNFLVSNFHISDTRTTFSGISLGWGGDNADGTAKIASNGTVEHFRSINAHYGYGAIQAQGSRNVEFRDIESVGGVALRLETGFKLLNEALARGGRMESSVDNVTAADLRSFSGQAALMLAPHAMQQGTVQASGVRSIGSEYAVLIAKGSLHKFTDQEIQDLGLIEGQWDSVIIDDVHATFTDGPIETRFSHLHHYPEEFGRNGEAPSVFRLPEDPGAYDHRLRGPSIAPVSNSLSDDNRVTVTDIDSVGFGYHPNQITDSDFTPLSDRGSVAMDGTPLAGRLLGDINDDQIWTAEDLDLLLDELDREAMVVQGGPLDLVNDDGMVTTDDIDHWLRSIVGSEYGDANLDGRVSFLDIETIASNFDQSGNWADGDFNKDGIVNRADLNLLQPFYAAHEADEQLTFQQAVARAGLAISVPEPGALFLLGVASAAVALRRRRVA